MSQVLVLESSNVVYVQLNRPDVRNAFNPKMIEELTQLFTEFSQRKDLRAIILSGAGQVFCSGADLQWMRDMVDFDLSQNKEDALKLQAMFQSISECQLPVIGHVHGAAMGGALGLIACCDYVVAVDTTQFCFSEVKLGLAPAIIAPFILRKVNHGIVAPRMIFGTVFNAEDAKIMGLIHDICVESKIHEYIEQMIASIKNSGPEAVCSTKKLLRTIPLLNEDQKKEYTSDLISERRVSLEGQDGLRSFLGKSKPSWILN